MRCKQCKQKFEPKWFNQKYCMINDECIKHFAEQTKLKAWNERKKKAKEDLKSLQDYILDAQKIFNKYIRLRDKGKNCISCGAKAGKYTITAGHYFPSTNKSVTFNEDNLHGQCWFNCNSSKSGNLAEYRIGLLERIGIERLEKLELESRKTKKYTIEELKEIIKKYKSLTK